MNNAHHLGTIEPFQYSLTEPMAYERSFLGKIGDLFLNVNNGGLRGRITSESAVAEPERNK